MKHLTLLAATAVLAFSLTSATVYAQTAEEPATDEQSEIEHGPNFIDEDGDGFNDLAPDADGDGIPNGQDEDYEGVANQRGKRAFIDEDGDGINDIAGDFDGDGVPNGLDPDFERGNQMKAQKGNRNFIDADGDGVNDNAMGTHRAGKRGGNAEASGRGRYGAMDGSGEQLRPEDGTGNGPGAGTEDCDETGPKGKTSRRGQRAQPQN